VNLTIPWRAAWAAFSLACLALLAGCGPTGGGTGTGESIVTAADFGARAASTCSAPFAEVLTCATVSASPVDAPLLAGTAPTVFTGTAASGTFTLTVQGNRADLQSGCTATRFEGEWGVLPNGDGRFFGSFTGPDRGAALRAQLWALAVSGAADTLQVLVQDAEGRALFGPLQMRVQAAPPGTRPICP
jgi:hypothetical protein